MFIFGVDLLMLLVGLVFAWLLHVVCHEYPYKRDLTGKRCHSKKGIAIYLSIKH